MNVVTILTKCGYIAYMKTNAPKSFVLQLGSLIALYVSITALIFLLFGIINLQFPDEIASYYENVSSRDTVRTAIAVLIVFFPVFVALTRISHQERRRHESGEYTILAKWIIYVSLLVAGGALLADFVTLIVYFLNGEISIRFLLKVFVFFAIVGGAFTYYLYDLKGFFNRNQSLSIKIAVFTGIIVLGSIVAGYLHIESPQEVREIKLDEQQIGDLQLIQSRIEEYYLVRSGFPESVGDLFVGETLPKAPTGRPEYRYVLTGDKTYQLCATFLNESQDLGRYPTEVFPMKIDNYSWAHGVGEKCFDRTIIEQNANQKI